MKGHTADIAFALGAGVLLTLMIDFNSVMAKYSTPYISSLIAHAVGAIVALCIVVIFIQNKTSARKSSTKHMQSKAPLWAYFGGIAGAFTVILAAIAVNSMLGLASSLALMLIGQVIYGIASDYFGLFGMPKRKFHRADFFVVLSILTGSAIILFFRS